MHKSKPSQPHCDTPHVVGIIGDPIAQSQSPTLHNALYRRLRLPWVYLPIRLRAAQLAQLPWLMRMCDIDGLNVTAPHKVAVVPYLDRLDRSAALAGAVNCIRRTGQRLIGYNTDIAGFRRALAQTWRLALHGTTVAIIGTGGAARACAVAALQDRCAQLTIIGRSATRRAALCAHLRRAFPRAPIAHAALTTPALRRALGAHTLLVQATSASARIAAHVQAALRGDAPAAIRYYFDCCYGTSAVVPRLAPAIQISDGTPMLIAQALDSIALWTGQQPSAAQRARWLSDTRNR